MRNLIAELRRRNVLRIAFREALDAGYRGSVMFDGWPLEVDPYLDSVREEPRFIAMIAELDGYIDDMRDRLLHAEAKGDFAPLRARAHQDPGA